MRARLLGLWERAVEENPVEAWNFGPPNWLVHERKLKGEEVFDTAVRVKAEYFPGGRP